METRRTYIIDDTHAKMREEEERSRVQPSGREKRRARRKLKRKSNGY